MVRKMYNLTLNEIIKQYKKKGITIITLLIFISAIAVCFIPKAFDHPNQTSLEIYKMQTDSTNAQLESLNKKTTEGKVSEAFLNIQKNQSSMLMKYNVEFGSWRYNESEDLLRAQTALAAIKLLKEGVAPAEITKNQNFSGNVSLINEFVNLAATKQNEIIEKLQKEQKELTNNIEKNDYLNYLNGNIQSAKANLKNLEKSKDNLTKELAKTPSNKKIQQELNHVNTSITTANQTIKVNRYRYDNKIPFDDSNWKSNTLDSINNNINMANTKPMTKEIYLENNHEKNITYEDYLEGANKQIQTAKDNIAKNWYSLDHNLPQAQFVKHSTRTVINTFASIYAIIVTVFIVIIASGIMSSEFSKNTIKLLVIRPASRFKILLAKLLSIYIIGYVVLFISMILVILTSGILYGFSDLSIPILKVTNGTVVTEAFFIYLIGTILFYSISMLFFGALSFLLSVATRSTAISVAVSIILYIGAPIVSLILISNGHLFLTKTPLPYLNLSTLSIIQGFLHGFGVPAVFSKLRGGIELIVLSIIYCIIAFINFIKKDIK